MSYSSNIVKIIFLDIDGVLLPFPINDENRPEEGFLFPKKTMRAFKRLLDSTQAKLVLSSTWRAQPKFVKDILDEFHRHGIKDMESFFDMTDVNWHSERQWEIHNWLEQRQTESISQICWLALDDEELIKGEANTKFGSRFEGHVVKPESSIGLTEANVDTAIQLWKTQLSFLC